MQELETKSTNTGALHHALDGAVRKLRGALLDAYTEVGADPDAPQEVSRRFGVTKSQAWKIAKVIRTADPLEAARHMPGRRGLERVVSALVEHGLPRATAERVRTDAKPFYDAVATHAGDRATLERTLQGLRAETTDPAALESCRKQSFSGNSGTWGIQARARISVRMLVPNADEPDFLDIANVSGLIDLQRLRAKGHWPVAQVSTTHAGGPPAPEPFEAHEGDVPFLEEFCTSPLPPIRRVELPDGVRFDLCDGPVGKAAAISCVFGLRYRRFAPIHASTPGEPAIHAALLRTPAELAIVDLYVHRDLPFQLPPTARLDSQMEVAALVDDPEARLELPLAEPVERLGSGPPFVGTHHAPRHGELVEHVARRMDCTLDDFSGFRLVLRYPPIPTMISLQHPLLER